MKIDLLNQVHIDFTRNYLMMYYSILYLSHIKRVKSLALLLPTHKNAHIISLDTKSTIFSQCQTLCVEAKGYKTRALIVCVPYDRYSIFLYIFQSTYFHPVDENEGCLFSILLPFLEVGKILVYVFFFIFVCCFAFFTEYVIEWCIFVNDSGSPFSFCYQFIFEQLALRALVFLTVLKAISTSICQRAYYCY